MLSMKSQYAFKALTYLSEKFNEGPVLISEIATKKKIPIKFLESILLELKKAGIIDMIIDPGFGFAKTIDHNFELLKNLSVLKILDRPIMLGVSRKSTIYKTLGITAEEALNGTTVLNTIGLLNGASILRVHDVKEAKEAVTLFSAMHK